MTLTTQPPKGTADWFPQEFQLRNSIFQVRRKVCISFGYEEYLGPIVEYADLYRAKSGEDVGGKELTIIIDRAGRELALRPEMTPTITRMIASKYAQLPKPVKYFSIANFFRNERPQRGRNREFWQLNFDCFGSNSVLSDIETIQIGIEIMKAYGSCTISTAKLQEYGVQTPFIVKVNSRTLINKTIDVILGEGDHKEVKTNIIRLLDKYEKLSSEDFETGLVALGLQVGQVSKFVEYMKMTEIKQVLSLYVDPSLVQDELVQLQQVVDGLTALGYGDYIKYVPSLMRGFDYYDGTVFEFFDQHPDNNRAMFGGGRYNGLASIFGVDSFPAVGAAPGDEPAKLFIQSRGLESQLIGQFKSNIVYLPLLDESLETQTMSLAQKLRNQGLNIKTSFDVKKFGKAIQFASEQGHESIVIFGTQENGSGVYKIKNLSTGEEVLHNL